MTQVAFAPKSGFDDPDALGAIYVSDSTEINVREAIEQGGGYIVTDDPQKIAALDRYEPLKRVAVSEATEAAESKSAPKSEKTTGKGRAD